MKKALKVYAAGILLLVFSGCVVTQYTNKKGEACTRRYFTLLGIPWSTCEASAAGAQAAIPLGEEIKIAPAAPATSASRTTPATTVAQNIRATAAVR